jgi:hypothetical protein
MKFKPEVIKQVRKMRTPGAYMILFGSSVLVTEIVDATNRDSQPNQPRMYDLGLLLSAAERNDFVGLLKVTDSDIPVFTENERKLLASYEGKVSHSIAYLKLNSKRIGYLPESSVMQNIISAWMYFEGNVSRLNIEHNSSEFF